MVLRRILYIGMIFWLTAQYWAGYQSLLMIILGSGIIVLYVFCYFDCTFKQAYVWNFFYAVNIGLIKEAYVVYAGVFNHKQWDDFYSYPRGHTYQEVIFWILGCLLLTDIRGNIVGSMNQDSFIENPGEQINSIQCTTLKLYFANETGDGLVEETRSDVYYSSNVSMEKLIMEQLLEGPQTEGAKSAIPTGTKLINVSVVDGVCYVSLDENFKNQDYQVNEAVVIYSIVDSLTELSTISKVQISVNGDTSGTYRDNFKLSDMYDRNLDYVVSLEETGVTEEE